MAYHTLPDSPRQYVPGYNVTRSGSLLSLLLFCIGMTLACLVTSALAVLVRPEPTSTSAEAILLIFFLCVAVLLVLSPLIKLILLRRLGGAPQLDIDLLGFWRPASAQTLGYTDVYAPDIYLTKGEYFQVNLAPRAVSLTVTVLLLAFGPPVIQAAVIFSLFRLCWILFLLINLIAVLRCPSGSLFVESGSGVLDIFRAVGLEST